MFIWPCQPSPPNTSISKLPCLPIHEFHYQLCGNGIVSQEAYYLWFQRHSKFERPTRSEVNPSFQFLVWLTLILAVALKVYYKSGIWPLARFVPSTLLTIYLAVLFLAMYPWGPLKCVHKQILSSLPIVPLPRFLECASH
jgi:hypothetical protein